MGTRRRLSVSVDRLSLKMKKRIGMSPLSKSDSFSLGKKRGVHSNSLSTITELFKKGDPVMVVKEGSQQGKTATVVNPTWDGPSGRLKVKMDDGNIVKSYLPAEVKKLEAHSWKKGDHVVVIKKGSQEGKTAVVVDPHWNRQGGKVKVQSDHDNIIRSYHCNEIKRLRHKGIGVVGSPVFLERKLRPATVWADKKPKVESDKDKTKPYIATAVGSLGPVVHPPKV